jgi:hypothetical protein
MGVLPDPKASDEPHKGCADDESEDPEDRPDSLPDKGRRQEFSVCNQDIIFLTINNRHGCGEEGRPPRTLWSVHHFRLPLDVLVERRDLLRSMA